MTPGRPELSAPVVVVVGPTASGKSDLAQELARRLGGEVVSADSMQVYRGMDIGTGKVPVLERRVPHHGLDLVDPGEPYSAALFQDYARRCFEAIDARGGRSILAGGTGLYVRAAVDDYDFPQGDQTENPVRERWTAFAEENGAMALWEEPCACDPESAAELHPHDVSARRAGLRASGRGHDVCRAAPQPGDARPGRAGLLFRPGRRPCEPGPAHRRAGRRHVRGGSRQRGRRPVGPGIPRR